MKKGRGEPLPLIDRSVDYFLASAFFSSFLAAAGAGFDGAGTVLPLPPRSTVLPPISSFATPSARVPGQGGAVGGLAAEGIEHAAGSASGVEDMGTGEEAGGE